MKKQGRENLLAFSFAKKGWGNESEIYLGMDRGISSGRRHLPVSCLAKIIFVDWFRCIASLLFLSGNGDSLPGLWADSQRA